MAEGPKATRLNDTVLVPSLGEAFPAIPKSTRALIAKALSSTYSELGKLKRRANLSDEEDDDDEAAEKPAEEFTHPSFPLSLQI